ncbi:MAG: PIN domain-containing protein [Desulfococcaceae bacterium]
MGESIVLDTNILFSALLRENSQWSRIILDSDHEFFICESTIIELFKHKEKLVKLSRLTEEELIRWFYLLLRRAIVIKEDWIEPPARNRACQLCRDVDPADTPFVALAIHLDGLLWTGDKALKSALEKKGFFSFFTS